METEERVEYQIETRERERVEEQRRVERDRCVCVEERTRESRGLGRREKTKKKVEGKERK